MGEWPVIRLKDAVDPRRGISYGIVQPGSPVDSGVPIVRVSDIRNGQIATESPLRVHRDIENQYARTRLRGGELLITIVGTVGETVIAPSTLAGWNVARAVAVIPVDPEIGAYWVQLALKSPSIRALIDSRLNTTVQATLNLGDLAQLPILLPPARTREAIAAILGALDDKIELNRRMNETLEAMARAIFKDWFVDFGPTRAKVAGQTPYLAPEIWSLFPGQLDDEGKPEGWRSDRLRAIVDLNPSEPLRVGHIAHYLDMAALPTSGPTPDAATAREFTSGMRFRNGDTLFARITPCLENGKTAFIQSLPKGGVGWGSTEFIVLRARSPVPAAFTYLLARDPSFRAHAVQSMTGTSGRQRARTDAIAEYPVTCPSVPSQ
jgi:type I restriction enzyme S subunit